eukprot:TRINITY_DN95181_c0_g1_i1.p1 TRINITY_DN95181_c0_g1~~TRINITY_DN95181_c0_g1_i1.p1  ORF type:complete len:258 (+),score=25.33 TRINITY_DN95181_c0_g1_i1:28-774(+)
MLRRVHFAFSKSGGKAGKGLALSVVSNGIRGSLPTTVASLAVGALKYAADDDVNPGVQDAAVALAAHVATSACTDSEWKQTAKKNLVRLWVWMWRPETISLWRGFAWGTAAVAVGVVPGTVLCCRPLLWWKYPELAAIVTKTTRVVAFGVVLLLAARAFTVGFAEAWSLARTMLEWWQWADALVGAAHPGVLVDSKMILFLGGCTGAAWDRWWLSNATRRSRAQQTCLLSLALLSSLCVLLFAHFTAV